MGDGSGLRGVIGIDGYRDGVGELCAFFARCYGDDAFFACTTHLTGNLGAADSEASATTANPDGSLLQRARGVRRRPLHPAQRLGCITAVCLNKPDCCCVRARVRGGSDRVAAVRPVLTGPH